MTHHDAHADSPAPVPPSAPATPPGSESVEELLSGVHARLLPAESLPPQVAGSMRYARTVADGLVFAYALDRPDMVRSLTDGDIERAEAEALGKAAYANLMRVPVEHDEVAVEGGAVLHTVYGDSFFVASKALYLDEVARKVTGAPLPRAGALVAVPTRHNLVFHPIADGSVVDALNSLATYALGAYQDGSGPLSPRVYWWHRGGLTSLTVIDHDTRTFSLQPPPQLLAMMKGLTKLDRAGRLNTRSTAQAPGLPELTAATADVLARAAEDPSALPDAFASTVDLAHARCAEDPRADLLPTWNAWATAVQLGTALFTGAGPQECRLGENLVRPLPAIPAAPPADARAWLDAFYLSLVCRQTDRLTRLCQVPMDRLREDDSVDAYVLHWIDTLRAYVLRAPVNDVVEKLTATLRTSMPQELTHAPAGYVDLVDHQPAALFHRILTRDPQAFAQALTEALAHHTTYWGSSPAPRARIALGPLALACLAHDYGFPVPEDHRLLPANLLNGRRIEDIP
ncbi:immunity 49 family protein [Streptomyces thermodiastaticus]|uniref:immunity 49 family protein n=1 Tax=Streptomyces thermodiastaticus TaxID=44061 RepID=UPI001E5D1265|nr:immunity 49 family protein [Streptomyces thermodiastaticus]MCE7548644.1 immunity 49 family protein [Streptomyces thermodiastaticus]